MNLSKGLSLVVLSLGLALGALAIHGLLQASDHDDGETDIKGRNLNLTDLYVFREIDQNPNANAEDLVFIMNTNPRSVARQQYFFSTNARYEFKVGRAQSNDATPIGLADVTLRFEFSAPDANNQQKITVTALLQGATFSTAQTVDGKAILTTPITMAGPLNNTISLAGSQLTVFAGLREDPFFFDVEQYFRVRSGALGKGPAVGFRSPGLDFAAGYNVNAIAVRVPRAFLQGATNATTFDVFETVSIADGKGGFAQVERLARPAINEGLIVTNDFLNALNSVGPDFEAAALAGKKPEADIAAPIVAEAIKTLKAVGNDDARALALIKAFLPDVMRIDTTQPSGYGNALNAQGSPIRGRLLTDDVIDITLSVVTNGAIKADNVTYVGPNAGGAGHKPLISAFPYLAEPN
jgi:hypothetical protein